MKWLILLALVPLSRILFYFAVCIGHKEQNTEYKYGIDIAKKIIAVHRLEGIVKVVAEGNEDFFDPTSNVINISEKNNRNTISSMAIAIHEVGHALQLNTGWVLYKIRCRIIIMKIPLIYISAALVIFGFVYNTCNILAVISLICLIICTVIELIVEINASVRGCRELSIYFRVSKSEMRKIKFIFYIAALTYFADIFYCLYLVCKLLFQMSKNEENEKSNNK